MQGKPRVRNLFQVDLEGCKGFEHRDGEEGTSCTRKNASKAHKWGIMGEQQGVHFGSRMHDKNEKRRTGKSDWGQIRGLWCQQRPFVPDSARSGGRCKGTPEVFEQKNDVVRCGLQEEKLCSPVSKGWRRKNLDKRDKLTAQAGGNLYCFQFINTHYGWC